MKKLFVICIMLLFSFPRLGAQGGERLYIQIDGMTADESGFIVRDVSIYSTHLRRGAASDHRGIFSIISTPGDTVFFSCIGYKPTLLTIPVTATGDHYTTDVMMVTDTIQIGEVLVLPWKTYSEFKRAVLENKPKDRLMENLEYNLAMVQQQIWSDTRPTPGEAYHYTMQRMSDELYTRGQLPGNNLLNPLAWQKFVQGVKSGMLKNEPSKEVRVKKQKSRKKKRRD